MAYFAKLGTGNIIETVISINNFVITDSNGIEQEQLGVDFINNLYGTNDIWKQTSYNTYGGIHKLGGTPLSNSAAGNGGKGIVILSMPDANYTGTTTGSPTVATGVSGKTVLTFNDSGSYTG